MPALSVPAMGKIVRERMVALLAPMKGDEDEEEGEDGVEDTD